MAVPRLARAHAEEREELADRRGLLVATGDQLVLDQVLQREGRRPRDVIGEVCFDALAREVGAVRGLEVVPEGSLDAEGQLQLDGGVGGDGRLAVDDLVDRLDGAAHSARKVGLRHAAILDRFEQDLPRGDRPVPLPRHLLSGHGSSPPP